MTLTGALATANGILFSGDSPITLTGGSITGNEAKEAIILLSNAGGVTLETSVSSDNITFGGVGDLAIKGNLTAAPSASGYINVNVDGSITWAQKNASCGATRFFRGRTTFAEGALVTVDLGTNTKFPERKVISWNEQPTGVKFVPIRFGRRDGRLVSKSDGLYFYTGISILLR